MRRPEPRSYGARMNEFHGCATRTVPVPQDEVFALITDVDRLPEWNRAIESVVSPPETLDAGGVWHVRMHPPRMPSWGSVSTVVVNDGCSRFAYETRNADGNPSWVQWSWDLSPTHDGTRVEVTWDVYLKTRDRRWFAGPLRRRQLAREVPRSLDELASALTEG